MTAKTESELRQLIADFLQGLRQSHNDVYIAHSDGLFRGLLLALTGSDHGHYLGKDTTKILKAADIYFQIAPDGLVHFDVTRKADGSERE
jgi:hypothetical protein